MKMMRLLLLVIVVILSLASVDSGNNNPTQKIRNVPHSLSSNSTHNARRSRANIPVAPQLKETERDQQQQQQPLQPLQLVKKEEEVKAAGRDKRGKYTITFPYSTLTKSSSSHFDEPQIMPRSSVFDIALRELIAEVAIRVVEAYERESEIGRAKWNPL